jgi:hypothetical protein
MVINVPRDKSKKKEMVDWLTDNISKENVRWWFTNPFSINNIVIDVTEEEEPMLTFFMLKWSSSE